MVSEAPLKETEAGLVPEGDGWFFKIRIADTAELEGLMDEAAYREWVTTL